MSEHQEQSQKQPAGPPSSAPFLRVPTPSDGSASQHKQQQSPAADSPTLPLPLHGVAPSPVKATVDASSLQLPTPSGRAAVPRAAASSSSSAPATAAAAVASSSRSSSVSASVSVSASTSRRPPPRRGQNSQASSFGAAAKHTAPGPSAAKMPQYQTRDGDPSQMKKSKQSMADLKLRRLTELNNRLREDLERERIPVSQAAKSIIAYCNSTRDYMVPSVWGPVQKSDDPYAPQQNGGCCVIM